MYQIKKKLRRKMRHEVEELQKGLHIADVNDITQYNTILMEEEREQIEMKNAVRALSSDGNGNGRSLSGPGRSLSGLRSQSFTRRSSNAAIKMDLMAYVRTIFLNIVRVCYWHQIETGKLNRAGYATQSLLYSIDNALDRVTKKKLRDW